MSFDKDRMHAYIVKNQSFPLYYLTGQKCVRRTEKISALPPLNAENETASESENNK